MNVRNVCVCMSGDYKKSVKCNDNVMQLILLQLLE